MSVLTNLRRFLRYLSPQSRRYFWGLIVLMVLAAGFEVVSLGTIPLFLGILAGGEAAHTHPWAAAANDALGLTGGRDLLVAGAVLVGTMFLVQTLFLAGVAYLRARYAARIITELSNRLFDAYLYAPLAFHAQRHSSTISSKIAVETMRLTNGFLSPCMRAFQSAVMVLAIGVLVVVATPPVALVVLIGMGLVAVAIMSALRRRARAYGATLTRHNASVMAHVSEALGSLKHIRLRGVERNVAQDFGRDARRRADAVAFQRLINELPKPILEGLSVVGVLVLVLVSMDAGSTIEDVIGRLGLLVAAVGRLLPHVNRGTTSALLMQQTTSVTEALTDELDALAHTESTHMAESAPPRPDAPLLTDRIALRGVSFRYPDADAPSIRQATLDIPKNAAVAFVGPTGAGKSTLVDLICGLLTPTEGEIRIDEAPLARHRRHWQRHIGYIPQTIFIADRNLRENVALGERPENIDDARVEHVLREAQLAEVLDTLPDGLATRLGESGVRLSGGQRQRIGIARALYHDPEVLILDEATAALDNETERRVMTAINAARANRTLIMIAHRLSSIRNCDRIFVMEDGAVTGAGTYDELLGSHAVFREIAA